MRAVFRNRFWMLGWLLLAAPVASAAEKAPAGSFPNAECISCHTPRHPQLVAAWRASSHARKSPKADCVACHGNTHRGTLPRARRDSACVLRGCLRPCCPRWRPRCGLRDALWSAAPRRAAMN